VEETAVARERCALTTRDHYARTGSRMLAKHEVLPLTAAVEAGTRRGGHRPCR